MIETLYGKLFDTDKEAGSVIIECGGVGYAVTVSAGTIARLPDPSFSPDGERLEGENVRLYTHMAVREDGVELFGFCTQEEIKMFRLLITVSGVGPKAAMSILSVFTPRSIANAVVMGDSKSLARAPGIGPKTAARITLELKDKVEKMFPSFPQESGTPSSVQVAKSEDTSKLADVRDALTALGYSRSEIAATMKDVDLSAEVEDIIKASLAVLMKN